MPAVTVKSTLAQRMGSQIAAAHQQVKDKPMPVGFTRLPGGIREGIAELRGCGFFPYRPDQKSYENYKGQEYFRAFGVVLTPEEHAGVQTSYMGFPAKDCATFYAGIIPMHATPAAGMKKERSFQENWSELELWFRIFGVNPPDLSKVPPQQHGDTIVAYYVAACKALVPEHGPKPQFKFSTRGWTPDQTAEQKAKGEKPEELVSEKWFAVVAEAHRINPATNGAVVDNSMAPEPFTEPPQGVVETPTPEPTPSTSGGGDAPADPADAIQEAVTLAEGDKEGSTPAGAVAIKLLKDAALSAGFTMDQVDGAASWTDVGNMAMGIAPESSDSSAGQQDTAAPTVMVGQKNKYLRRDGKGNPLINVKTKSPFPHIDVEVVSVDAAAKTVTVKTADGKVVTGIGKGAGPVQVKWEWLE